MNRRDFLVLAGATAAWPLTARAQQTTGLPVIGFLILPLASAFQDQVAGFKKGLEENGFVDGRNVVIDYRWAENNADRVPGLLGDLLKLHPAVIALSGGVAPAVKASGTTIPVLGNWGSVDAALNYVGDIARPTTNFTGVNLLAGSLEAKRLGLLHDLVPTARRAAILDNPATGTQAQLSSAQDAADRLSLDLTVLNANSVQTIEAAFAALRERPVDLLLVAASPFFNGQRKQIVQLAAELRVPAIYEWREFVTDGGLMSYGTRIGDGYRQMGIYAALVLKGTKVADLPVVTSNTFDFVINLKTAKALGLTLPPLILAQATEIIE